MLRHRAEKGVNGSIPRQTSPRSQKGITLYEAHEVHEGTPRSSCEGLLLGGWCAEKAWTGRGRGTHSHIARKIKEFGIDSSHFLGCAANHGPNHKGPHKLSWQEVLVLRHNGRRQKPYRLRRALIESGRAYRCEAKGCSIQGEWLGKRLILHVNHKNGNWLDDRPENVEFHCPNCHSQTPNYCKNSGLVELTTQAQWWREYRKRKRNKGPVAESADAFGLGPKALNGCEGSSPSGAIPVG
jgi:hypothetical protein